MRRGLEDAGRADVGERGGELGARSRHRANGAGVPPRLATKRLFVMRSCATSSARAGQAQRGGDRCDRLDRHVLELVGHDIAWPAKAASACGRDNRPA